MKGSTVSASLNGQMVLGHSYNAVVSDGGLGMIVLEGQASFDSMLFKTDDPNLSTITDPTPVASDPVPVATIETYHEASATSAIIPPEYSIRYGGES